MQSGTETEEVCYVRFRRIDPVLGPLAITTAPLIEGQDIVVFTHRGREVVPGMRMSAQPVEQYQRQIVRGTPIEIVELQTIGHNSFVLRLYL